MILLLFLGTLALGLLAQWHVKRAYARHRRTPVQSGYKGAEARTKSCARPASPTWASSRARNSLGDHSAPKHQRLVLSSANDHGTSAAALGVAAHGCGHALQHQQAYAGLPSALPGWLRAGMSRGLKGAGRDGTHEFQGDDSLLPHAR